ncbi:MAG: chemotaxis protein CheA [Clostridia bacterium]
MTSNIFNEHMLEVFLFETTELMEQLEEQLLHIEQSKYMTKDGIDEIFRIMHTTKGSSAMMQLEEISVLTHRFEDLFFYIRENNLLSTDIDEITELGFIMIDFIRNEIAKLEDNKQADGDSGNLKDRINILLNKLKTPAAVHDNTEKVSEETSRPEVTVNDTDIIQVRTDEVEEKKGKYYEAKVFFDPDCGMLNIRAYTVIRNITDYCNDITHIPEGLMDSEDASKIIAKDGFVIRFSTDHEYKEIEKLLKESLFVSDIKLASITNQKEIENHTEEKEEESADFALTNDNQNGITQKKSIISVNIEKMDKLMDLVGEIVITESMVINNPDLKGLQLDNFYKSAAQLKKLNNELQDVVMSIRMIPIAATFHKMHRIVRDMNKKLDKNVELYIYGEETEVDKSIIDSLGDPLIHLVRNSMDHGIEDTETRKKLHKPEKGKVILDAQNNGSEITISIRDDGKGLDRHVIYEKAKLHGLVSKAEEEMSDKEVFALIFLAGFSTNTDVTEFSGRGVGLDVVRKTIEKLGGNISVDSIKGEGTTINMRIPLTLAIIDGMKVSVGKTIFTIPITSIKESMKVKKEDIVKDTTGREMVMIRGKAYPVIRLHNHFELESEINDLTEGILIMVESEDSAFCVFADTIIGEQQVVVKPIPAYIGKCQNGNSGIAGCAILDDANISIIIDVTGLHSQIIK